jgi:hypothetical protein
MATDVTGAMTGRFVTRLLPSAHLHGWSPVFMGPDPRQQLCETRIAGDPTKLSTHYRSSSARISSGHLCFFPFAARAVA